MTGARSMDSTPDRVGTSAVEGSRRWSREVVLGGALIVGAAIVRFWSLPARGGFDSDQGRDMIVLLRLVRDGVIPLVGPSASIGSFHHGAVYYYLLAPVALLTGVDPTALTAEIAAFGLLAVLLTALATRVVAGARAALVAALLAGVSAAAIHESTYLWNPNLVPASAALAILGALMASSGRPRWWLVAWVGGALTAQLHLLGALILPPIVALQVASIRVRDVEPAQRRATTRAFVAGLAIVAVSFVPLLVSEVESGFAETRSIASFAAAGGGSAGGAIMRLPIVALRVLSWPLAGLVTIAPDVSVFVALAVAAAAVWLWRRPDPRRREIRWLIATLVWGILVLSIVAPALTTVVVELPVDHYHAFIDPIVVILLAAASVRLVDDATPRLRGPARVAAVVGGGLLCAWNVSIWPASVASDGGWPAAQAAATRIERSIPASATAILSVPPFKGPDAYAFALERDGLAVTDVTSTSPPWPAAKRLVVVCDDVFDQVTGVPCKGPAEAARLATVPGSPSLLDRFEAAPGRWLSVYALAR